MCVRVKTTIIGVRLIGRVVVKCATRSDNNNKTTIRRTGTTPTGPDRYQTKNYTGHHPTLLSWSRRGGPTSHTDRKTRRPNAYRFHGTLVTKITTHDLMFTTTRPIRRTPIIVVLTLTHMYGGRYNICRNWFYPLHWTFLSEWKYHTHTHTHTYMWFLPNVYTMVLPLTLMNGFYVNTTGIPYVCTAL